MNRYRVDQRVKVNFIIWQGRTGEKPITWHEGRITGTFIGYGRYLATIDSMPKLGQLDVMHYELYPMYPDTEAARLLYE